MEIFERSKNKFIVEREDEAPKVMKKGEQESWLISSTGEGKTKKKKYKSSHEDQTGENETSSRDVRAI